MQGDRHHHFGEFLIQSINWRIKWNYSISAILHSIRNFERDIPKTPEPDRMH